MKESAGTLLYRNGSDGIEVLLVHPSGNYNKHAPWSIPKGLADEGENDFAVTARRETLEETGVTAGELIDLGHIEYRKSRKRIHCYAGKAPADAAPHTASWEVDQACFLPLEKARTAIHPDQIAFLDRLVEYLRR
jgi:predicted NUDIX family NTP pyrophosphohydrolase